MKIGVLVKTVNFLYAQSGTDIANNFVDIDDYVRIINPLDEMAMEYALQLKERLPWAEVTAIGYGQEAEEKSCRRSLAMGADHAIHLVMEHLDELDAFAVSHILSLLCRSQQFDLILCGAAAIDTNDGLNGPFLAERLRMSHLSNVVKIDFKEAGKTLAVQRLIEAGNRQLMECDLPVLLTVAKSGITPRYPTLAGFLRAAVAVVETKQPGDFKDDGLIDPLTLNRVVVSKYSRPVPRQQDGTAKLAKMAAKKRISFMIDGDAGSEQDGGQIVEAGSNEMYVRWRALLTESGIIKQPVF